MGRGNVLIGQSGGPTSVINASLVGVVEGAKASRKMGRVFGMRFGIEERRVSGCGDRGH